MWVGEHGLFVRRYSSFYFWSNLRVFLRRKITREGNKGFGKTCLNLLETSFPNCPEIDPPQGGDPDFRKLVFARGPETPAKIIDEKRQANANQKWVLKFFEILSLPKSPEIDPPPPGEDLDFRKIIFARGPKTPAKNLSIID